MTEETLSVPVNTADGGRAEFAGHYFTAESTPTGVLQVLVHGNSYDHRYWDFGPVNNNAYSYVQYMTARGHDVLAVDLPGTGSSSRPDGDAVSLESVGDGLSDMILKVRAGKRLSERAVGHVSLIGHSLGAILCVQTQGRLQPADSVIVTATGYFRGRDDQGFGPGVREGALATSYATLSPEAREHAFYYPQMADPDVISYDNEVLRTTLPRRLWADGLVARDNLETSAIGGVECPVYVQLGEHDRIMPGKHATEEREFWLEHSGAGHRVVVEQLADIGHSFNLHRNHEDGWHRIDRFLAAQMA
ncbi:alpha/beta hydrolase [Arthrobacter sp. FW306-2-2C-D06B]|uniref:alpha/beta hydrolase n=1 Tax=Arthrobacter sp. FW306-2-2C-D06B TaxID=2879618 RepID=UPI001F3911C9|nr:alpha/beta fold hydrolase [Arthrobacter sp. FW306-2-2C-D06B]UKA60413.1 alpha/beta fold hydrolase [Arthrobacter sp. FW306-2-2C-D06B]